MMRDSMGRFCPGELDNQQQRSQNIEKRIRAMEQQKKRFSKLSWYESNLLHILVGQFDENCRAKRNKSFSPNTSGYYPRKSYHSVLMKHAISHNRKKPGDHGPITNSTARVDFSRFINRMVQCGFIEKIKHGKHLYLRITQRGLDKIIAHDEIRNGII